MCGSAWVRTRRDLPFKDIPEDWQSKLQEAWTGAGAISEAANTHEIKKECPLGHDEIVTYKLSSSGSGRLTSGPFRGRPQWVPTYGQRYWGEESRLVRRLLRWLAPQRRNGR